LSTRRTPKPVLLLLLALAALLAPQATKPTAPAPVAGITRAIAATHVAASTSTHRGGIEHPQSDRTELRTATAPTLTPTPSTSARDAHVADPRLLLVQRPRPPTVRLDGTGPRAANGRSPPSPAGT
jgi:hypothetical protein